VRNTFDLPKFSGSSNILFKDLEHGYNAVDVAIVQNQKDCTALLLTYGYIPVHKDATQPWRNLHSPIVHDSKKLRYPAAETKAVVIESSETNSCPDDDAEHVRKQGNQLFKIGNFEAALLAFKQACVLLPSCPLAPSNAAQSALEMGEYQQALDFALQGFQRDNSHVKTWFRLVKALAFLSRASEAFVWVADLAFKYPDIAETRLDLFEAIAACSPYCDVLHTGVCIERVCGSGYKVVTLKPIKVHALISSEVAVVPWTCRDVWEPARMKLFLESVTEEQANIDLSMNIHR